jgi:putative SOS response-associated peptidase YedK
MVWDGRASGGTDYEGRRLQHWFGADDGTLTALAGVWKDSEVPSFAIVTCSANEAIRKIGRETAPVVLGDEAARHTWLHAGWDRARALITTC